MQLSCQSLKHLPVDRYFPSLLIFLMCPLVLIFQRYAVVILALSAVWSITYLRKIWTTLDVHNLLKCQINPTSLFERYLNYGLVLLAISDYFKPYKNQYMELKICSLLICGFLWWHALQHHDSKTPAKLRNVLFYSITTCCLLILIDYLCGNLLVTHAEEIGKNRALIFSKMGMTLSLAIWPILYNQPFWKVSAACITLMSIIMPLLDCDTAIVGLAFSLCAYGIASIEAKLFWRLIQAKILIICLGLPFVFNVFLTDANIHEINKTLHSYSYIHRLYIWQYTSQKIMERPFIGFGYNAAMQEDVGGTIVTKPFYEQFKNGQGVQANPIEKKQIPTHPHNMILQWWLESGLLGALWWASLLVFLIEKIRKLPKSNRKIAFSFFTSNMMILLVSISFWQSWWWATWLFLLPFLTISKK
jgi:hypothetical protein